MQLRVNQEHFDEDLISRFAEIPESSSPRRISMINPDQGRTNVIKEILQAEQDYVKHMKDVVEVRHYNMKHCSSDRVESWKLENTIPLTHGKKYFVKFTCRKFCKKFYKLK